AAGAAGGLERAGRAVAVPLPALRSRIRDVSAHIVKAGATIRYSTSRGHVTFRRCVTPRAPRGCCPSSFGQGEPGVEKPLAIRVLEATESPPSGHGYQTHVHPYPTWEQIEAAVRALNHYCLPFIFIGLRDGCEGEDCLSVLGGPNGYAITAE